MQWRLLFAVCQLLDDPGTLEKEVKDIAWSLFQVDEEDQSTAAITGLHESVLETDLTGREMPSRKRSTGHSSFNEPVALAAHAGCRARLCAV
jgi:hypothetical protein